MWHSWQCCFPRSHKSQTNTSTHIYKDFEITKTLTESTYTMIDECHPYRHPFSPVSAPHAKCPAAMLLLYVKNAGQTKFQGKGHLKGNFIPVGWNTTYELLKVLLQLTCPHSTFSCLTYLFPISAGFYKTLLTPDRLKPCFLTPQNSWSLCGRRVDMQLNRSRNVV